MDPVRDRLDNGVFSRCEDRAPISDEGGRLAVVARAPARWATVFSSVVTPGALAGVVEPERGRDNLSRAGFIDRPCRSGGAGAWPGPVPSAGVDGRDDVAAGEIRGVADDGIADFPRRTMVNGFSVDDRMEREIGAMRSTDVCAKFGGSVSKESA
ncbi:MAG: hypothetical protein ACRYGL_11620 [Janthinobacterium lividum]